MGRIEITREEVKVKLCRVKLYTPLSSQQAHSFIFHFYFSDIELRFGADCEGGNITEYKI